MDQALFLETLKAIVTVAKTENNYMTKEQVKNYLTESGLELEEEKYVFVYQYLGENGVAVEGFDFKPVGKQTEEENQQETVWNDNDENDHNYNNDNKYNGSRHDKEISSGSLEAYVTGTASNPASKMETPKKETYDTFVSEYDNIPKDGNPLENGNVSKTGNLLDIGNVLENGNTLENGNVLEAGNPLENGNVVKAGNPSDNGSISEEDSVYLKMYLDDLKGIPVLSENEKRTLWTEIKNGKETAKQPFMNGYFHEVVEIAKQYRNKGANMEDLIQEGNMALLMAFESIMELDTMEQADGYLKDSIKEGIEQLIDAEVIDSDWEHTVLAKVNLIHEAAKYLAEELGRAATVQELAEYTKMSEEEIEDARQLSKDVL